MFIASHCICSMLFSAVLLDEVDVDAFTYRSLQDGFEWEDGYSAHSGLFSVNFSDTFRARTPRSSANYFGKLTRARGVLRESVPVTANPATATTTAAATTTTTTTTTTLTPCMTVKDDTTPKPTTAKPTTTTISQTSSNPMTSTPPSTASPATPAPSACQCPNSSNNAVRNTAVRELLVLLALLMIIHW